MLCLSSLFLLKTLNALVGPKELIGLQPFNMITPRLSVGLAILIASSAGAHGYNAEANDATTLFLRGSSVDSDVYKSLTENSVKVTALRGAFLEWVEEHKRVYETVEDEMKRMLVWIENHGEFYCSCGG